MSETVKENMAAHPVGIVTASGVTQPLHRHNPPEKQRPCMFQTVCLQDKTFNCKSSIQKNSAEFLFQVTAVCFRMIGTE